MAKTSNKKPKKSHNLVMGRTGAYAIAVAAGIDRRHGIKQDRKKLRSRRACRGKVSW